MKRDLMGILACPLCKGDLKLEIREENNENVVIGTLYCAKDNHYYLIEEGIPNLLPPSQ